MGNSEHSGQFSNAIFRSEAILMLPVCAFLRSAIIRRFDNRGKVGNERSTFVELLVRGRD